MSWTAPHAYEAPQTGDPDSLSGYAETRIGSLHANAAATELPNIDANPSEVVQAPSPPENITMSDLEQRFEQAQQDAQSLPERPDDETMLALYALYKQGSQGDVQGERPGMFDFVGGAKYDAWAELKGTPQERAQEQYIELVDRLQAR